MVGHSGPRRAARRGDTDAAIRLYGYGANPSVARADRQRSVHTDEGENRALEATDRGGRGMRARGPLGGDLQRDDGRYGAREGRARHAQVGGRVGGGVRANSGRTDGRQAGSEAAALSPTREKRFSSSEGRGSWEESRDRSTSSVCGASCRRVAP